MPCVEVLRLLTLQQLVFLQIIVWPVGFSLTEPDPTYYEGFVVGWVWLRETTWVLQSPPRILKSIFHLSYYS